MTETPQKDPRSEKHGVWGRFEFLGSSGVLRGPTDTITDTVPPLHFTTLTNTRLLFLLFYQCCRPEERDRAGIPDSDNISNQASKSHFTNHPVGQQRAAGLHRLSHSSCVKVLLHNMLSVDLHRAAD